MSGFLDTVQSRAKPGTWSQAVKLVREGAVRGVERGADELTFRVRAAGHAIAPTVILFLGDEEWDCDCGGPVDPCAHVVAAAIAWSQSADGARDLFAAASNEGHMAYRLLVVHKALTLERTLVAADGVETPLLEPLADLVARRSPKLTFAPTHDDLTVDRWMGRRPRGELRAEALSPILAALASAKSLTLDGHPVRTSGEAIAPTARVIDGDGGGVTLMIERDGRVTGVVAYGVVRAGEVVHPAGETQLTGLELEKLPIERRFRHAELGELVSRTLPELSARVAVDVRTGRLPDRRRGTGPRIHFELDNLGGGDDQRESGLSLLPSLVYGHPPVARIDAGRLVHLSGEIPVRDEPKEVELVLRLRDELNLAPGRRVILRGVDAARMVSRLDTFRGSEGEPALRGTNRSIVRGRLEPRIEIDDDRFDVVFRIEDAGGDDAAHDIHVGAEAVLGAFGEGLGYTALEDGSLAALPLDWLERFGDRVADLLAARSERKQVRAAALPLLGELCDELGRSRPPALDALAPLLEGFEGIPDVAPPSDLEGELRPYQARGYHWLSFCKRAGLGAILADDMGLGKTLQAMCVLGGRSLVVCPKSVVFNWAEELARFRPSLRISLYHGPKRALSFATGSPAGEDEGAHVTLTTYATLRNDIDRLSAIRWDVALLDEAQAIKNPASQAARAAYRLDAGFRMALTGTPVENRLDELWSQVHFTNPGLLGTRQSFAERFAAPIERGDPAAAERLRARLRPILLRRLKRDVLPELPPRTEQSLYCELDPSERAVYDAVRAATRKEVLGELAKGGSVIAALELLLRLRQAACHPALVPGQNGDGSAKVERLVDALEELCADGHKALVFSQWTSFLDLVEPHLDARGIARGRLDGKTKDRAAVVSSFQAEGGPPVLLLSLKAGGVGLNLTAADHVFLLDPWWNPAVEDQAADRAHRIGQDRPVMVYRLVAKDTVEEGILALQTKKRHLAEAAIQGRRDSPSSGDAVGITRDDLIALLAEA